MRRPASVIAIVALLASLGAGCIARTLPIPPPGASIFSDSCDIATCGDEGVIVRIDGLARPGAIVVAENTSRHLPDQRRFSASAFATEDITDAGAGDGGNPGMGRYEVYFGPQRDPMGVITACHHLDTIVVYQLVRNADNNWEPSSSVMITVP